MSSRSLTGQACLSAHSICFVAQSRSPRLHTRHTIKTEVCNSYGETGLQCKHSVGQHRVQIKWSTVHTSSVGLLEADVKVCHEGDLIWNEGPSCETRSHRKGYQMDNLHGPRWLAFTFRQITEEGGPANDVVGAARARGRAAGSGGGSQGGQSCGLGGA